MQSPFQGLKDCLPKWREFVQVIHTYSMHAQENKLEWANIGMHCITCAYNYTYEEKVTMHHDWLPCLIVWLQVCIHKKARNDKMSGTCMSLCIS